MPVTKARALTLIAALAGCPVIATAAQARDRLGTFDQWAAFRDPAVPRCYAIATTSKEHGTGGIAYADVAYWPRRNARGAFHLHLSRRVAPRTPLTLNLSGQHFHLVGSASDAWGADARMDAGIVAAMRSASAMAISARDAAGRAFVDSFPLGGAATAMDAAALGCAGVH